MLIDLLAVFANVLSAKLLGLQAAVRKGCRAIHLAANLQVVSFRMGSVLSPLSSIITITNLF